jgi:PncC family amidohydrolase
MASGIQKQSHTDIGLSTTGIAGPTGGTRDKSVGLVYIGLALPEKTITKQFQFSGNRLENKEDACNAALNLLYEELLRV